jgi:hypothetical protein
MLPLGELNLRLSQNAETFCESYQNPRHVRTLSKKAEHMRSRFHKQPISEIGMPVCTILSLLL